MSTQRNRSIHGRRRRAGFTLIEAALTTVIVGTGVLAMVAAQQAYHLKNQWAQRTGTAYLLANELRELTLTLPMYDPIHGKSLLGPQPGQTSIEDYNSLDDFAGPVGAGGTRAGLTFDPPVNAMRQQIEGMNGWRQHIEVVNVLPENIAATFVQPLGTTPMMRVTVRVQYKGPRDQEHQTITHLTWLVTE